MITFHDLFCGAGGSTLGGALAGATPLLGANHWPVACESYAANHPEARVDCADVCTVDPRRYPRADVLLASPECTHHSYARGRAKDDPSLFDPEGDMGAERSRATMWDVVRFTEFHEYSAVIVENVVAATKWGSRAGQKLKHDEYGPLFSAWLMAMRNLGYRSKIVSLNSMTAGVPQSRDRIYVVFTKKGLQVDLDITPTCWCGRCGQLVRGVQTWKRHGAVAGTYGAQYVYGCPGCGERVAPVITPAAAAIDWSLPAPRIGDRTRPLRPNTLKRIRRGLDRLEQRGDVVTLNQLLAGGPAVDPDGLIVQTGGNLAERPGQTRAWPTDEPLKVITGTADRGLVVKTTHAGADDRSRAAAAEPLPTQTTRQEQALVVSNMANNVPRLADGEPAATVTSGGKLALVYAGRENAVPKPAHGEPMQTATTINSLYLVQANRRNAIAKDAATDPLHTLDTKGAGYLVDAQAAMQVDLRGENRPRPVDGEPLSTIHARGQVHGLAYVVGNYTPGWLRDAHDRPLGTITSSDHHSLLTHRGPGDVRNVAEPVSTITSHQQHALLDRGRSPSEIQVEDCGFRMLQPHELQLAQGFPATYQLTGNKRDQVMQIGNAVSPPAATELVRRVLAAIGGAA